MTDSFSPNSSNDAGTADTSDVQGPTCIMTKTIDRQVILVLQLTQFVSYLIGYFAVVYRQRAKLNLSTLKLTTVELVVQTISLGVVGPIVLVKNSEYETDYFSPIDHWMSTVSFITLINAYCPIIFLTKIYQAEIQMDETKQIPEIISKMRRIWRILYAFLIGLTLFIAATYFASTAIIQKYVFNEGIKVLYVSSSIFYVAIMMFCVYCSFKYHLMLLRFVSILSNIQKLQSTLLKSIISIFSLYNYAMWIALIVLIALEFRSDLNNDECPRIAVNL